MRSRYRNVSALVATMMIVALAVSPALAKKTVEWTLSTYTSAQAFGRTTIPNEGGTYTFTFEQTSAYKTGNAYLTTNAPPPSTLGLKADVSVATATGTPTFLGTGCNGGLCSCSNGTNGNFGLMFEKTKYKTGLDRWFYNPRNYNLASPLTTTLSAPFADLAGWTSSNGQRATDNVAAFDEAKASIGDWGVSFGTCFYNDGTGTQNGTATFTLTPLTYTAP